MQRDLFQCKTNTFAIAYVMTQTVKQSLVSRNIIEKKEKQINVSRGLDTKRQVISQLTTVQLSDITADYRAAVLHWSAKAFRINENIYSSMQNKVAEQVQRNTL